MSMLRANQLVGVPASPVRIALSGRRLLSSQNTSCGLICSPLTCARASSSAYQSLEILCDLVAPGVLGFERQ